MRINFSEEVSYALTNGGPVVALESTVISHGLPQPENLETAIELEKIVRDNGAVPATVAVFDGEFHAGVSISQLERLAKPEDIRKVSTRDLAIVQAQKLDGATTVATTIFVARNAGIKVFATGGIGGIHRGISYDVSADLPALANTPVITVCSGAKIVLDLPATREWLETYGVTVLGFECDEMPAFYSRRSGLFVDARVDSLDEIIEIANARDDLGTPGAVLVTVPVPKAFEVDSEVLEKVLEDSVRLASDGSIQGKDLTPFLLSELSKRTNGKTLSANLALLKNNATVAACLAVKLCAQ